MARSIRITFQASVQVSTVKFVGNRADVCTKKCYSPPGSVENQGN